MDMPDSSLASDCSSSLTSSAVAMTAENRSTHTHRTNARTIVFPPLLASKSGAHIGDPQWDLRVVRPGLAVNLVMLEGACRIVQIQVAENPEILVRRRKIRKTHDPLLLKR